MSKEIVGLIPVKGSSERIKMKNLRKFGDTSLFELKLSQLSPLGEIIEQWTLNNAFIVSAGFGSYDWSDDAVQEIELSIRFDWAILDF